PLFAELPHLAPEPSHLLTLLGREAIRALASIERGLLHPVPDRLGGGLELPAQLLWRSSLPHQLNEPRPKLWRVRSMALRHRGRSLPPQPWGVHENRSWVRTHPRGMKVEYLRPAPRAGQRRTRVVRRVRRKRDVGASGTPHCCFEHGEQTRDHDRSCRPRRLAEGGYHGSHHRAWLWVGRAQGEQ